MKKILLILITITIAFSADCQKIKVRKLKKAELSTKAYFPTFSNNKNDILFTGMNHKGLFLYNTRSKEEKQLSDARNADSKISEIPELASYIKASPQYPSIKTNGKQIEIDLNSEENITLSPSGDCYYLWASLSPDKTRILYTATSKGTFISDLQGNILHSLNNLNDPSWINDEWIVGMNDDDDGEKILTSEIVAIHLSSNKKSILTDKDQVIAMYPKFSNSADRLVFSTPDGNIYTARIRLRN